MLILNNEYIQGTRIVYENGKCEIKKNNEVDGIVNGVGILTDEEELVGVFLSEELVKFIYRDVVTIIQVESFRIENEYVSKTERLFRVLNGEDSICEIKYVPFLDPGMIIYDSEEDEFDPLLIFSEMFSNMQCTSNSINYIKYLQSIE